MGIDTGKVKVTGIVNKTFHVEERQECHDAMKNKSVIKAALVFDYIDTQNRIFQHSLQCALRSQG
jgi:hypothetical protein